MFNRKAKRIRELEVELSNANHIIKRQVEEINVKSERINDMIDDLQRRIAFLEIERSRKIDIKCKDFKETSSSCWWIESVEGHRACRDCGLIILVKSGDVLPSKCTRCG